MVTDNDAKIKSFVEKPSLEEGKRVGSSNINAGIYILEPDVLKPIKNEQVSSFEYDVFPNLLKEKMPFFAQVMAGDYSGTSDHPKDIWLGIRTFSSEL